MENSCQKSHLEEFDELFARIASKATPKPPKNNADTKTLKSKKNIDDSERMSRGSSIIKNGGMPIHLRYSKEIQERENRLCSLKKSLEREKHDKLVRENSQLQSRSNSKMKVANPYDVTQALQKSTKKFLERKNSHIKQLESDLKSREEQHLTFQPKINKKSNLIAEKAGVRSANVACKFVSGARETIQRG